MRILLVHNDYGRYSGEEAVVDRMMADARAAGHEVETLRRSSASSRDRLWGQIRGFFAGVYSFSGRRMMRKKLRTFRPDIVNVHNLYPFISPAVLFICRRHGVPVVMTVHNYRLICPTGLFLRDNRPCEECLHRGNELGCIRHNCEHNRLRSLGYAIRNTVARRTRAYKDCVSYFCCLTEFQREKLIEAGFDGNRIMVFPNYVENIEERSESAGDYVAYIGRLSHEKGYDLLMEVAHRHPEIAFRFAGTLRENEQVEELPNVKLCGQLPSQELEHFYAGSRFVVIPSRCYEGFPMAILEASSHGKPCIAPNHGAFPEIMRDKDNGELGGLLFRPLDVDDLERAVVELWNDCERCSKLGFVASHNCGAHFLKREINKRWEFFLDNLQKTGQASCREL